MKLAQWRTMQPVRCPSEHSQNSIRTKERFRTFLHFFRLPGRYSGPSYYILPLGQRFPYGTFLLLHLSMDNRVSLVELREGIDPTPIHCSLFFTKAAEIAVVGLQVSASQGLKRLVLIFFRPPGRHPL